MSLLLANTLSRCSGHVSCKLELGGLWGFARSARIEALAPIRCIETQPTVEASFVTLRMSAIELSHSEPESLLQVG